MTSRFRRSLEVRMLVAVGGVLALLLTLWLAVSLSFHSDDTYQLLQEHVEVLADSIHNGLAKDMKAGRSSDVQQILESVGTEKGIVAVRISDRDGKVLRSANPSEVGRAIPDDPRGRLPTDERGHLAVAGGRQVLHVDHPIENLPACHGCHDARVPVNGILSVEYDLEPERANIRAHSLRMAGVLLFIIILAGLAIHVLLKSLVTQPILVLRGAMAQAETGRLDTPVSVTSTDELGTLQQGFNNMITHLRELNEKTLAQQRDLVRQEEELKHQEVLAERNRALEQAHREISEKNRYYMEMLSFISHEMKNPVAVLKGYSKLLLGGNLGALPKEQKDAVGAMDRQTASLETMIANYLSLARVERGELHAVKRRVDLAADVVRPVLEEFAEALRLSSRTATLEAADGALPLDADPTLLKSAVGNLVSNAIKYGEKDTPIEIRLVSEKDGVRLSVQNKGCGIAEADRERVFERFTRLKNPETLAQKGTGLGLWIVRDIVERHGGRVSVESEPGAWARFCIHLPRGA